MGRVFDGVVVDHARGQPLDPLGRLPDMVLVYRNVFRGGYGDNVAGDALAIDAFKNKFPLIGMRQL